MSLSFFNTLTRSKEIFTPITPGVATMYTCGPTVYGRPHIGNYSSFLLADLLRRWLTVRGYEVHHVKNITDVGHLVKDAETGEDKIEKEARRIAVQERGEHAEVSMEDVLAVSRLYTEQYLADEEALHILPVDSPPHAQPKATDTIPKMLAMISALMASGHAYETDDGVYFDVQTFPAYGKLSGNTLDKLGKLMQGVRIDIRSGKKHPADFALWKKRVGENAHHVLYWESPFGDGFPGWHIECSAMSLQYFGERFDIHTGGEDNIFPHHECEIAQSEGMFGHSVVSYWLHKRRVNFGEEKMSKSLGNVLSLDDIRERGFHALDLRYFFCSSHYRSHTSFTWKGLEDAKKSRLRVGEWMREVGSGKWEVEGNMQEGVTGQISDLRGGAEGERKKGKEGREAEGKAEDFVKRFEEAMDDDLNTPEAMAVIFEAMAWSRRENMLSSAALAKLTAMLRDTFACFDREETAVPADVTALVAEREDARAHKDFAASDRLRDEILKRGFIVEDLPEGARVKRSG